MKRFQKFPPLRLSTALSTEDCIIVFDTCTKLRRHHLQGGIAEENMFAYMY